MRLTRQTNYAIRMLMYCATNGGRLSRVGEIAAAYQVSDLFLFKILQPLVEAGFVETVRGRNGGIRLKRDASTITLREVVTVTEENFALAECFETGAQDCPLVDSCSLNAALRAALDAFLGVLGAHTIESLVHDKSFMRRRLGLADPAELAVAV
ncbi:iron-responsive transcriptional regulator RirA [Mangrovibrevibacter kandeliae]|uniref:iron-responsive transcriptional regulator RirA n=1 Tax=Mangrovibrevibacter kandeliae TaxID=2968473 RepID=UPI002119512E|nr:MULTISPECIES: iron-responsive transcriptional regulator RirA [unclassified Aurantimonas]MCQ8783928.1 iron-responsive transcriptional regulator RirA [Aurantimonas sp. CSK15Z-1]MCW4116646.1 iron-responsive transcriptional regulator RirA [Aurantimonas sp. MSK8Z-1]